MDHDYWDLHLHAYLDDELEPADRRAVEGHLKECESCRRNAEHFRVMKRRLRAHRDLVEMPESARTRLEAVVRQGRYRQRRRKFVLAAAALAAVALIALLPLWRGPTITPQDGNMLGTLVCHDCVVADRAGLPAMELCADGHRIGLRADTGELWRFGHTEKALPIINNMNLFQHLVEVKGRVLEDHHIILIDELRDLSTGTSPGRKTQPESAVAGL